MCECGCIGNDERYTLPGPGKSFYIVSLSGMCLSCDAAPGVRIELIEPSNILFKDYNRGEFVDGPFPLVDWGDNKGNEIVTGFRKSEFVAAVLSHLNGLVVKDFTEKGRFDESSAEVILEEMYEDSQVKPTLAADKATT